MKLLQDFNDLMWVTIVDSELLFVGCECLWSERVDCIHCVTIYSVFVWLSIFFTNFDLDYSMILLMWGTRIHENCIRASPTNEIHSVHTPVTHLQAHAH